MSKTSFAASVLLFLPIFVTYVPGGGFVTSANPFNLFELPSVPLSGIVLPILALYFLKLRTLIIISVIFFAAVVYGVVIWQATGLFRQFFYVLSLALAMMAYFIGLTVFRDENGLETVKTLNSILMGVVLVKLVFDFASGRAMSEFFIVPTLSIYNFYDYFPMIYFLLFTLSLELLFRTGRPRYLLGVVLGLLVFLTWSRLFQLTVMFASFYYLFQIYRVNKNTQIVVTLLFVVVLTMSVALLINPHNVTDLSFQERFKHWGEFLHSFAPADFILPFLNTYRQELDSGTFHNELLDIFSYFGLSILIIFVFFQDAVSVSDRSTRRVSALVIIVFILGSVVQSNITQFYSCIAFFFLIGALNSPTNTTTLKEV